MAAVNTFCALLLLCGSAGVGTSATSIDPGREALKAKRIAIEQAAEDEARRRARIAARKAAEEAARQAAALAEAAAEEAAAEAVALPTSSSVNWDAIAACESGGNWSINSTYDGGLQFHPDTWTGYGGNEFAPYAYQATREQQIVVAERVLAGQGIGAWPHCGQYG